MYVLNFQILDKLWRVNLLKQYIFAMHRLTNGVADKMLRTESRNKVKKNNIVLEEQKIKLEIERLRKEINDAK